MLSKVLTNIQNAIQEQIVISMLEVEEREEALKIASQFKKHQLFTMFTGEFITNPSILSHYINPSYGNLFDKIIMAAGRPMEEKIYDFEVNFFAFVRDNISGKYGNISDFSYWSKDGIWNEIFLKVIASPSFQQESLSFSPTENGIENLLSLFYSGAKYTLNSYIMQMEEKALWFEEMFHTKKDRISFATDEKTLEPQEMQLLDGTTIYSNQEDTETLFQYLQSSQKETFHLLLIGEGGMGKTTFLNHIHLHEKEFDEVFYFSLTAILNTALSHPILDAQYQEKGSGYILREIANQYNIVEEEIHNKKYLLLLDGYNELLDCNTSKTYHFIQSIKNEIAMFPEAFRNNISVIITSRAISDDAKLKGYERCTITGIPEERIESMLEKEKRKELISSEIQALLCIPLYYKFFSNMSKDMMPQTKYELLEMLHRSSYQQTAEHKNIFEKDIYLFSYFILVPHIAKRMELMRENRISKADVFLITKQLIKEKSYIIRIINQVTKDQHHEITLPNSLDGFWDFLKNRFDYRNSDCMQNEFQFVHQEFQEYFAAFSVVYDLETFSHAYESMELFSYHLDFNLKSNVQSLLSSALSSHYHTKKLLQIYPKIFPIPKENRIPFTLDKDLFFKKISNEIQLAYIAFLFSTNFILYTQSKWRDSCIFDGDTHYFTNELINLRHQILSPICKFCTGSQEIFTSLLFPEEYISNLLSVISGELQFWRNRDLSICRKYINFAEQLLQKVPEKRVVFQHQKAKALLCNAEYIYTNQIKTSYYEEARSGNSLFYEAILLLERACEKGYNTSATLLERIYSTPCMWIVEQHLVQIDFLKSFSVASQCFQKMTTGWFQQNGTELVYLARSILFLLLKGYIQLTADGKAEINTQNGLPNSYTLSYIISILKKIDGQNYPLLYWIKGWFEIVKQPFNQITREIYKKAADYFSKEKEYILTDIVALFVFPTEQDLESIYGEKISREQLLKRLQKKLRSMKCCSENQCDKYDPVYSFWDVKKILLIMQKNHLFAENREKERQNLFQQLQDFIQKIECTLYQNPNFHKIEQQIFPIE